MFWRWRHWPARMVGKTPVDEAIRAAAASKTVPDAPKLIKFEAFDPRQEDVRGDCNECDGKPTAYREGRLHRRHRPRPAVANRHGRRQGARRQGLPRVGGGHWLRDRDAALGTRRTQRPASQRLGGARQRVARAGRPHRDGDGRRTGDGGHCCDSSWARWRRLPSRTDPRHRPSRAIRGLRGCPAGGQVQARQGVSEGRPYRRHVRRRG